MTTAARPTFDTAKGGSSRNEKSLSSLSKQYSARDLPSHTKLKYRQHGQGTSDELKSKDFRRELEERELKAKQREGKKDWELESPDIAEPKKLKLEDFSKLDADVKLDFADNEDDDEDFDSDSDEDEDDTEALLAELNRIKKERAAEEAKKQQEKEAEEQKIRNENILSGNPLLNAGSSSNFKVKRRWDDDVVFKNCAKGEKAPEKRGFINDTLRSEFHKKFMDRYIQ